MEALHHLAITWAGTLVAVVLARKTRLTPVVYYLGVGAVLVNIGWLPEDSDPFIRAFAEVGIILIMFALGFEENAANFLGSIKRSWGIAFFGALAPYLSGYIFAMVVWESQSVALMVGLAMTATAVSLTMVALRGEGLGRSEVATRIMTSAVLDDVASLALVAIVVPLVTTEGHQVDASLIFLIIGKSMAFFLMVTILGALIFPRIPARWGRALPWIDRFGIGPLLRWDQGKHATLQVLLLALGVALLGETMGLHPAVGAYLAGLILRAEYFRTEEKSGYLPGSFHDTKRIIDNIAFSWIGPVFFVVLGTKIVLDPKIVLAVAPYVFALTAAVAISQVTAASLAARYTGGMDKHASILVGIGMLGRAELAFVVMDIAYVQHPILTEEAFYTLMGTCLLLNIAVPVGIHWWKPRYVESREADQEGEE